MQLVEHVEPAVLVHTHLTAVFETRWWSPADGVPRRVTLDPSFDVFEVPAMSNI